MAESKIIKSDFRLLNNLVKGLSENAVVRIGIMGAKAARASGKITNAEVGAVHEFGSVTKNIPQRSFLRMPIHQKSDDVVKAAKTAVNTLPEKASKKPILKTIGIACEIAIQKAFDTRGFGRWKPNKKATAFAKGSKNVESASPLIDTAQLRRSITSAVGTPS